MPVEFIKTNKDGHGKPDGTFKVRRPDGSEKDLKCDEVEWVRLTHEGTYGEESVAKTLTITDKNGKEYQFSYRDRTSTDDDGKPVIRISSDSIPLSSIYKIKLDDGDGTEPTIIENISTVKADRYKLPNDWHY